MVRIVRVLHVSQASRLRGEILAADLGHCSQVDDGGGSEFRQVDTLVLYLDCTNLLVSICEATPVSLSSDINMLEK